MRILVIAKRFKKTSKDDALNRYQSGIRISEELKRQGHEVNISFYDFYDLDVAGIKQYYLEFKPDFVFQTGGVNRSFNTLKFLKNLGAKIVIWHPDAYWLHQKDSKHLFLEVFDIVDLFITTMKGHVEISKPYTDKVVWSPHFFDHTYYKSNNILAKADDVVFVGNKTLCSLQRKEYLEEIIKKGYRTIIVGWGFNPLGGVINYDGKFIVDCYKKSKIGLNMITGGEFNYNLQFSVRMYQVMGSGCFLLTEYIPGIEELFIPEKHLDIFHTKEEMLEKIDYYLKNEDEREKIAIQGQEEIFDKYTIDKSVDRYLSIIKERLGL